MAFCTVLYAHLQTELMT